MCSLTTFSARNSIFETASFNDITNNIDSITNDREKRTFKKFFFSSFSFTICCRVS